MTTLDLSVVQEALERLVDRVVLAIRFMAAFTLATGTLVLIGALATSRFQRIREGALLRTLGATRSQLFRIVLAEYFALGAMAAAVAAGLSAAAAWALAKWVFEGRFSPQPLSLAVLVLGVVALTVTVGLLNSREVIRRTPLEVLRGECCYYSPMLPIDLTGKRALVAGVSDDAGFGFAIAKSLAEAGATICLGSWPPALGIFTKLLERGKIEDSLHLAGGRKLEFERIYPLDAAWDRLDDVPQDVRENKRYKEQGDFTIAGLTARIREDFGEGGLDIVVHSLANGPEVKSPLVDTSRAGYLAAVSVSAYSNISLVRNLAPLMRSGRRVPLTHLSRG